MTTATAPSVPSFPLPLLNNPAPAAPDAATPTVAAGVSVGAVAIETHGCKLNQADSAVLARQFAQAGCRLVDAPAHADIVIVNTCTVTAAADAKARQALRAARRQNPQAIVIAAGCYPQRAAAELRRMPEISLVAGNQDKPQLVALALAELARQRGPRPTPAPGAGNTDTDADTNIATDTYAPVDSPGNAAPAGILRRSRAMLKIQEGCDQVCAYCIVPKVRGRERSIPADDLITAVRAHLAGGYREITLTGTQLGAYGFDLPHINLTGLLNRILDETELPRLRVSSLQAHEITPDLLACWQNPRLCPHFHIPLQSGCDAILRAMRRRYRADDYRRAVALVRRALPDAAVTTDIIVGFPGETPAHHEASLALAAAMDFADLHLFPYSPRPGTTAYHLPAPVGDAEKRRRAAEMAAIRAAGFTAYRRRQLGHTRPVLWETARPAATPGAMLWSGLTDNYIRVAAETDAGVSLANRIVPARLHRLDGKNVRATLDLSSAPPPGAPTP